MRQRLGARLLTITSAAACLAALGGGVASAGDATPVASASGGWTIQSTYAPTPKQADPKDVALEYVSCSAANACLTIGRAGSRFLSETWNGTTWTPKLNKYPSGGGQESDVACSGAGACTLVGFAFTGSGGTTEINWAERWNGSSWQQQSVPAPAGASAPGLSGVSCPDNQFCDAVGDYSPGGVTSEDDAMAAAWNGTSWALQPTPSTGYQQSGLSDVSCPTTTDCVAVGDVTNDRLTQDNTLAESWNGTSWTIQPTPALPASDQAFLSTVSCPTTSFCMATGGYMQNGAFVNLLESWNGTSWSILPSPPDGYGVSSLSCPSATSCTAIGVQGTTQGVAAQWNGSTWTFQDLPVPAGAKAIDSMNDISCPTTSACETVGFFQVPSKTSGFRDKTLIEGN